MNRLSLLAVLAVLIAVCSSLASAQSCQPKPDPKFCLQPSACGPMCGYEKCVGLYLPQAQAYYSACQAQMAKCSAMPPQMIQPCKAAAATAYKSQHEAALKQGQALKGVLQAMPCTDQLATDAQIIPCKQCIMAAACKLTKKQQQAVKPKTYAEQVMKKMQDLKDIGQMASQLAQAASKMGGGKQKGTSVTGSGGEDPLIYPNSDIEYGGNVLNTASLQPGTDSLTLDRSAGSMEVAMAGSSVELLKNDAGGLNRLSFPPPSVPYGESLLNPARVVPDNAYAANLYDGASLESVSRYMRVTDQASSTGLATPSLSAAAVAGYKVKTRVRFFPGAPPEAALGEVTVGYLPPDWIKAVPRSNARVDFYADEGMVSSLSRQFGIPRGFSNMASAQNLGARTVLTYSLDGVKDYDYLLSNGFVIWPHSGAPGGKIISSSFGIPPDQYLSEQQREMVYG